MTNYDEVIGWADTIDEVVKQGRMPPWHADPRFGHFVNDIRLTDVDKKLIADWVQAGTPQGDPMDLPKPPEVVPPPAAVCRRSPAAPSWVRRLSFVAPQVGAAWWPAGGAGSVEVGPAPGGARRRFTGAR